MIKLASSLRKKYCTVGTALNVRTSTIFYTVNVHVVKYATITATK